MAKRGNAAIHDGCERPDVRMDFADPPAGILSGMLVVEQETGSVLVEVVEVA